MCLPEAEATLESRERALDRVAMRLAELVVDHRQELRAVRAELAEERGRKPADRGPGAAADDVHLADHSFSHTQTFPSVAEPSPVSETTSRR